MGFVGVELRGRGGIAQDDRFVVLAVLEEQGGKPDGPVAVAPIIVRIGDGVPRAELEFLDVGPDRGVVRLVCRCGEHGSVDPVVTRGEVVVEHHPLAFEIGICLRGVFVGQIEVYLVVG